MSSDFDNDDDTPNLIADLLRLKHEHAAVLKTLATTQKDLATLHETTKKEITQLRGGIQRREEFFEALQRAFVVLEGRLRREQELRQFLEYRVSGLVPAVELILCQQEPIDLPNWKKTHTLLLNGETPTEQRLSIMAGWEPGKTERRYRLYQEDEYQQAAAWMRSGFEQTDYRCLRFADFEFYAGSLFHKNARWWNPFQLVKL